MAKQGKNATTTVHTNDDDVEVDLTAALGDFESFAQSEGLVAVVGTSFAPYCKPIVGKKMIFTPDAIDVRDPEFIRCVSIWQGDESLMCATGPVADAEPVEVKKGERFSMSQYASIPFEALMGLKVFAMCTGTRQLGKNKQGLPRAPMYEFKFLLSKVDSETYKLRQAERASAVLAQAKENARLATAAAVNGLPVSPSTSRPAQQNLGA